MIFKVQGPVYPMWTADIYTFMPARVLQFPGMTCCNQEEQTDQCMELNSFKITLTYISSKILILTRPSQQKVSRIRHTPCHVDSLTPKHLRYPRSSHHTTLPGKLWLSALSLMANRSILLSTKVSAFIRNLKVMTYLISVFILNNLYLGLNTFHLSYCWKSSPLMGIIPTKRDLPLAPIHQAGVATGVSWEFYPGTNVNLYSDTTLSRQSGLAPWQLWVIFQCQ